MSLRFDHCREWFLSLSDQGRGPPGNSFQSTTIRTGKAAASRRMEHCIASAAGGPGAVLSHLGAHILHAQVPQRCSNFARAGVASMATVESRT